MSRTVALALMLIVLPVASALAAGVDSPFGSHLPCDDALLKLGREAGVAWTRSHDYWTPFYWTPTQPEPDKWVWQDEQVAKVRGYGYEILGMLGQPPAWASEQAAVDAAGPHGYVAQYATYNLPAWENYVYQTVSHYRGQVRHWEIWNEPNIRMFFSPDPNPALYFVLLERAYKAAKRADPNCVILAPCPSTIDLEWVESLLRLGLPRVCDVISVHAYAAYPGLGLPERIEALKALLHRYACDKPVWITEVGYGTPDDKVGDPEAESEKANHHMHLNLIAWSHGVERIFAYPFCGGTGGFVRDDNKQPLTLFQAYANMTRVLDGARPAAILSENPELWAYLFTRGSTAIAALWAEDPMRVEVPTGVPQVQVVERDGASRSARTRDGWLSLTLGPTPVYLVGVNGERMRALERCRVEPAYQRVIGDTSIEVIVAVTNPTDAPRPVEVRPVGLEPWQVDPTAIGARLAPQERREFSFKLRAPAPEAVPSSVETRLYADDRPTALTARRAALDFDVASAGARLARVRATVDVADDNGFIRDWLLSGPFDNSDRKGLDRVYEPEQALAGPYQTLEGLQPWRHFHTNDVLGLVDLGQFYGRRDSVCAFALCYLHSPTQQAAELRVGRNDEMAVFLGGKEVWRKAGGRMVIPDDDTIAITLPAGTTPLLLKVCNWARDWGFCARLTAPGGKPLTNVRVTLAPEG